MCTVPLTYGSSTSTTPEKANPNPVFLLLSLFNMKTTMKDEDICDGSLPLD